MNLKPEFIVLLSVSLLIFNNCSKDPVPIPNPTDTTKTLENLSFQHDGLTRRYRLYKPDSLPGNAPLVFVLHGLLQGALDGIPFGFNQIADTAGFAVCYPQGATSNNGTPHWNAGLNESFTTVDDIGYLSELATFLQQEHDLDSNRTFCCGFSNGGYMCYTLACEASDVFKAIASVSGYMSGYTWGNCVPHDPIPVLHIIGLDDEPALLEGSSEPGTIGWGGAPALDVIIKFWADLNKCTTADTVALTDRTTAYYFRDGIEGNEVWCYKISNHAHQWPMSGDPSGIHAAEEIWGFFNKY